MTTSPNQALKHTSYLCLTLTSLLLSSNSYGEGRLDTSEDNKPLIKLALAKNNTAKNIKKDNSDDGGC